MHYFFFTRQSHEGATQSIYLGFLGRKPTIVSQQVMTCTPLRNWDYEGLNLNFEKPGSARFLPSQKQS